MSDEDVIKGYLEGKREAFDLITGWIRQAVDRRVWAGRVSPDDVLADTREKLLFNLRHDKFRLEASLKTYVQRMALYTCVDAVRRERTLTVRSIDETVPATGMPDPHEVLEKNEEEQLFQRIVELLPDNCRLLWTMVFVGKLKVPQIAARLGRTEGAIRTSLSRCKEKAIELRKRLT